MMPTTKEDKEEKEYVCKVCGEEFDSYTVFIRDTVGNLVCHSTRYNSGLGSGTLCEEHRRELSKIMFSEIKLMLGDRAEMKAQNSSFKDTDTSAGIESLRLAVMEMEEKYDTEIEYNMKEEEEENG